MNNEVWKDVPGFEGLYDVSNLGNVRRLVFRNRHGFTKGKGPRVLKPGMKKIGYPRYSLYKDGKCFQIFGHHLVLMAFVGPRPEGKEGAHLDGNPFNCTLGNLAWVTRKENHSHKKIHGTSQHGENHGAAKLTEAAVREIRARYAAGAKIAHLAKEYGVSWTTTQDVLKWRRWAHVR